MINLFTSNRLEILTGKLSDILKTPLQNPLESEVIVVQSAGMKRKISMDLAQRNGICANICFMFPNNFAQQVFAKLMPEANESSPFDPFVMTWKIMQILPSLIDHPEFASLEHYIRNSEDLKRFQLAGRIADTFDQYLLFRPEMILSWEKGKDDHWQAILWRKLADGNEHRHRAALAKVFLEKLKSFSGNIGLPQRISIFGISALPRYYVELFAALSHLTEVNLFLMNPCEEFWEDVLSRREIRRLAAKSQEIDSEDLHLWQGNSLLASMGTLGRDFFRLINEFELNLHETRLFDDPGEESLLTCIQSDIMNLRERSEKMLIDGHDNSIQIHSCHSHIREIQVLQDHLLEMFEHDPELKPADILVMTPDIGAYSPYIQGIFDLRHDDPRKIPFSIADRSIVQESRIIESFLMIPELYGTRFGAAQIMDILENPAIRQRFGLSDSDTEIIHRWIRDTRIRWGKDEKHRASLDLPDFPQNTWQAGIDRLLLGMAMPGYDEKLFAGILPYDHIEGNETIILGKFLEFIDKLFSAIKAFGHPKTLSEWSYTFKNILENFFRPDEAHEHELRKIRDCLNQLEQMQILAEFDEAVDIHVIKNLLSARLNQEGFGFGFLTGNVTFCAMLPMRSIPFKVICLIGMSSDSYPRRSETPGFDLIAKHPKPGDRSRRNDDRYLFLESLLSARKTLYISYVGQSIQDNSVIPPSVLVSELFDYIEKNFEISDKKIIDDYILVKHRLQAFSGKYFEECKVQSAKCKKLFSYSEENLHAAKALLLPKNEVKPFICNRLSEPEDEWKNIDINDLCLFFTHPARFLLNRRLRLYLDEKDGALDETESFDLKGLEQYLLNQNLLEKCLKGVDLKGFFDVKTAAGELPHGTIGECAYQNFSKKTELFADKLKPYISEFPKESVEIDLKIQEFSIIGRIEGIYSQRLIRFRYAAIKPKDRLRAWIYHLILNMTKEMSTILIGSDQIIEYKPLKESDKILYNLLMRYWQGLQKPLLFFPKTSLTYAEDILKGKDRTEAAEYAVFSWSGDEYNPENNENNDPYYRQCFKNPNPIDESFEEIAIEIFEPMLRHEK